MLGGRYIVYSWWAVGNSGEGSLGQKGASLCDKDAACHTSQERIGVTCQDGIGDTCNNVSRIANLECREGNARLLLRHETIAAAICLCL